MENLKEETKKEIKAEKKNKKINGKNLTIIILVIVLIFFIIIGWFGILNNLRLVVTKQKISVDKAGKIAINYINENILRGRSTAILDKISYDKNSDLYKIKLTIGRQSFTSYVTKNGKLLFPQGLEIEKKEISQKSENKIKPQEIAKAELFVMAFCPYGNQAEDAMAPVVKLLNKKADIQLHYIVSKNANGEFDSLHGEQELHQDIRELCVAKYQKEKLWDFVEAINKETNASNVDKKWEKIARKIGLDVAKIKNCQKNEAKELLEEEYNLSQQYKVSASPTLIINGVRYQGERTSEAYKKAICSGFITQPEECQEKLSVNNGNVSGSCK